MQKYRLQAVFAISPSVAMLCPIASRKFGKTASFLHSISSTIYLSGKNVLSRPRVINAHLQQQDHVASQLCTVDFWLIDIWVLTVATK